MNIVRAVFEKGVQVRYEDDCWKVPFAPPLAFVSMTTFEDVVAALFPLRPLVVTTRFDGGDNHPRLLRIDGRQYFDVCVSSLMNRSITAENLFPVYHLEYLLNGINYHCQRLAELYVQIVGRYHQITQIPGYGEEREGGLFQNQLEPYYEFDALVGAVRRSYDSTRYLLWPRFGNARGTMPKSLSAFLESSSRIPETLHARLTFSWKKFGMPLKDYRDCLHHYVPVDFGMASAVMRPHPLCVWTTTVRIPDNPEVKSKKKFTFSLNRDALTYAWELADEVLSVAIAVVEAVIPPIKLMLELTTKVLE
jgi:hypothetical protein